MTVEKTRVERIPVQTQPTPVSDELGRLQAALAELCPKDSTISFEYDGKLHLHVDLRGFEDVNRMEAYCPPCSEASSTMCAGRWPDPTPSSIG